MAKSELLEKIREDFFAARCGVPTTIDTFCDFAVKWMSERGIAGVGHLSGGLSLRFRDGTELALLSPEEAPQMPTVAVSLSAHKIDRLPNTEPVAVTGQQNR